MIAKPFNLVGVDIGRTHLNGSREINNDRLLRCWAKHLINRITNFHGKIQLSTGKTLGAVLKGPLCLWVTVGLCLHQLGAFNSDFSNAGLIELKNISALNRRRRVIKVHDRTLDPT